MSSQDDKTIQIEVNGIPLKAKPGQMLIEVTDQADIYVPRFCYHRKLSVAANCRMCLVDVEKAPKPLPACATPVADGMKVSTRSERAISAQKATMEFLLINHPLDCPICDQGGECELQDLAVGFGRGVSRYTERKRVVRDKNLGPLVSTDMTRCIHCTRCVRFGQEIAGIQQLGAVGRSENMEIGTYIEQSINHELSANIIDLCPVGALNNKPYRFSARAWEMEARPMVSPHDCAGSNMYGHVLRGRLRRVVPRDNEAINESWISDRDRFSCHGIESAERLTEPMLKADGRWANVPWTVALEVASNALTAAVADGDEAGLGMLVSPNATLEEMHLLRRIASHLGTRNVDYRLRRTDFADQENDPVYPYLGCEIKDLPDLDGVLLIGSDIRNEVPIIAHRIRQAAVGNEAAVGFLNAQRYEYFFPVAGHTVAPAAEWTRALAAIVAAAAKASGAKLPKAAAKLRAGTEFGAEHEETAKALVGKDNALVLLGHLAQRHPNFSTLRVLAQALCDITGAKLGYLSEGGNASGASLTGCLPHRLAGGERSVVTGKNALRMLYEPCKAYLLFGVEPDGDFADSELARQALGAAKKVVAFSAFKDESLMQCADVLLPIGTFAETSGTYVNVEGRWQTAKGAAKPVGDSRPGWRVLRVLGNQLGVESCEYSSTEEILEELQSALGGVEPKSAYAGDFEPSLADSAVTIEDLAVGLYRVDALVRRSAPLQEAAREGVRRSSPIAEAKSA